MDKSSITEILDLWESANLAIEPIKKQVQLEFVNQIASTFSVGEF